MANASGFARSSTQNSIWDVFSRREEYEVKFRDRYNRFPYYMSRNRQIFSPVVSEFLYQKGFHVEWPDNHTFALCLTHDIDRIFTNFTDITRRAVGCLFTKDAMRFGGHLLSFIQKKKYGRGVVSKIVDIEKKRGGISTFFIMATDIDPEDGNYTTANLSNELCYLLDSGNEIGLHGSKTAHCSLEQMKKEKREVEKVTAKNIESYRNHYLVIALPQTWNLLHESGFKYDCTLGYADCAGFRNGMCHPFEPYDLLKHNYIPILEIPLTVMDGTILDYMKLDHGRAWTLLEDLIGKTHDVNGVFTLLWHNTYFTGKDLELYEKIIDHCSKMGAWLTSCREIGEYWRKQSYDREIKRIFSEFLVR